MSIEQHVVEMPEPSEAEIFDFPTPETVLDKVKRYGGAVLAMAKTAITNQID